MEYCFDCSTQYLKSECSEQAGYIVQQDKSGISCLSIKEPHIILFIIQYNYSLIMTFLVIFQRLILATFKRFFKDSPNLSECNKNVSK